MNLQKKHNVSEQKNVAFNYFSNNVIYNDKETVL